MSSVSNKTENLNIHVFNMIIGKYHEIVNVNLMEENVIQINDGITINVNVSAKNFIYVKKIIFGILLHVVVKMKST